MMRKVTFYIQGSHIIVDHLSLLYYDLLNSYFQSIHLYLDFPENTMTYLMKNQYNPAQVGIMQAPERDPSYDCK